MDARPQLNALRQEWGASGLVAAVDAGGKKSRLQALALAPGPRTALTSPRRSGPGCSAEPGRARSLC